MNLKRISLVLAICLAVAPALGLSPEGRGAAMGGAYSPLAKGAEGMLYNPATLGSVTLAGALLGGGVDVSNNALSLMDMVNLATGSGSGFTKSLDKISEKGKWEGHIDGAAGGAVDVMGVGVAAYQRIMASGKDVSRETVELVLSKDHVIQKQDDGIYEMTGTSELSSILEISAGYGGELPVPLPIGKLSGGAAVKLYKGTAYALMESDSVLDTVNPPASNKTTGSNMYANATSGQGFGFDVGVHAELAVVDASLAVKNIGSKVKWDAKGQVAGLNKTTLKMDSTETSGTIDQTIPMVVLLGVGGTIPVVGTAASAELEMAGKGQSKPKDGDAIETSKAQTIVRLGLEQGLLGVLSLRAGYASGGSDSDGQITVGLGLGALIARLDLAVGYGLDQKSGSFGASGSVSF